MISIDHIPHGVMGIEGFTGITYPNDFSFGKVDEALFEFLSEKDFSNNNVSIRIRYVGQDQYGKDTLSGWNSIGTLNAKEAKLYVSFNKWNDKFSIQKLLTEKALRSTGSPISNNYLNGQISTNSAIPNSVSPSTDNMLNPYELRDFYPFIYEVADGFAMDTVEITGTLTHYKSGEIEDVMTITTEDGINNFNLSFNSLKSGKARQSPEVPIKKGDKIRAVCAMTSEKTAILLSAKVNIEGQ
jgi:hypothetical protein